MTPVIVAIAGNIGSGKTTLSRCLAEKLGCSQASFGEYVRMVARERGLSLSRQVLQEIGAALIEEDLDNFCLSVLARARWVPGQSLVIDGIRHVETIQTLRRLTAPTPVRLVLISTDDLTRQFRIQERSVCEHVHLAEIEAHSTETQVNTVLPLIADRIANGTRRVDEVACELIAWLESGIPATE